MYHGCIACPSGTLRFDMPRRPPNTLPFFQRRSTPWLIGALILLAIAGILSAISRGDSGPRRVQGPTVTAIASASAIGATSSLAAPTSRAAPTPERDATVTVVTLNLSVDPAQLQTARVIDAIDGDTIDVEINGTTERIRYYGVDTPERGEACFSDATGRTEELIGSSVLLLPDARNRDPSGRLLRYVFDAQGASIDARLIAEGLALAWRADGTYRDHLVGLEEQARISGIGCLWDD